MQAVEFFFLNTWLWSMTWGILHIPINMLVVLVLLKFVARLKLVPAILLSFFSKVFSSALYTLIIFFLTFVVKFNFAQTQNFEEPSSINVLLACVCLGLVYAVFQAVFFVIVRKFYNFNLRIVVMIALLSNLITALLVYRFLEIN